MEQRSANSCRMTINERRFIEKALLSELRFDGRCPFAYCQLTIKFGRHCDVCSEEGSSEVQLGQTHVVPFVTSQLVQPYRDRPNEGTRSVFTEFSPIADPSLEPGRPREYAVELGCMVDRGLRESRAVDTESLCVLAGRLVWAIRVDLHILDDGGPECTLEGDDGQEVTVHPPEVKEPLPLIIHHLPLAVTFAFFGSGDIPVIDPTHYEEAVMRGRMTATINASGDVCVVQKAGGEGVMQSVEAYNTERALEKVKRHSSFDAIEVDEPYIKLKEHRNPYVFKEIGESLKYHENRLKEELDRRRSENDGVEIRNFSSQQGASISGENVKSRISGPSNWDPYSKGIAPDFLRRLQASPGILSFNPLNLKEAFLCIF
ncbi:exosome complex component RRP45A isoform X1 [Cinnamomum micranthum f. kanehirae]|uniref:Exosome complex component RRP45A isoform X1 n=1 Tax=Cinnamomum micranthum f. kanehirae TaxID=337451 RepID=A0A443PM95_9MAGN|nr:exosome complex component RRP45A isoform X1 [Cinnamomum micranthum f. kanehirae]